MEMETDNNEINTQPTGMDSQSQKPDSSEPEPWGRLLGASNFPQVINLIKPRYTFGRDNTCMFEIKLEMLNNNNRYYLAISKQHFTLSWDDNLHHAVIEDCSSNGTYINHQRIKESSVSKQKREVIKNGSLISLAGKIDAFTFIDVREIRQKYDYPQPVLDKYSICDAIGRGASGLVHSAIEKGELKRYALKVINKRNPDSVVGMNTAASIQNEIKIMQSLDHPFVVKIKDVLDYPDRCFIVMEYMGGGTLASTIKPGNTLAEPQAKFIFLQLLRAVKYLHSMKVIHRDLKPENILIYCQEDEPLLKVSDFGLSKFESDDPMTFCGSQLYVAPEVISGKNKKMYTNQVDIWSLGVILYLTLIGVHPFKPDVKSNMTLYDQIQRGRYDRRNSKWKSLSVDARSVIESMLVVEPNKRASITQLEVCNWLNDPEIIKKVKNRMKGEQDFASPSLRIFSQEEPEVKKPKLELETPTTSTEEAGEASCLLLNRGSSDDARESTNMLRTLSFDT